MLLHGYEILAHEYQACETYIYGSPDFHRWPIAMDMSLLLSIVCCAWASQKQLGQSCPKVFEMRKGLNLG